MRMRLVIKLFKLRLKCIGTLVPGFWNQLMKNASVMSFLEWGYLLKDSRAYLWNIKELNWTAVTDLI